jgi:hypothetical protein
MGAIPRTYIFLFELLIVAALTCACMWICDLVPLLYHDLLKRWNASRRRFV